MGKLGYEHLRRRDLRRIGPAWRAAAGVLAHQPIKITKHGSLTTAQRYLHPDHQPASDAEDLLSSTCGYHATHLRAVQ